MYESNPFIDLGRGKTSGKTDITNMEESGENSFERSAANLALEIDEATRRQMSPRGKLGLTPLLEDKRHEHGIIDPCFAHCASFDRILVWQIPAKEQLGETGLVMPQISQKRISQETPKGIIVSAGLGALDVMRSNGMAVGDTILFIKQGMWRITAGNIRGVEVHLMVLSVGDICSNEDQADRLRRGDIRYDFDKETGEHALVERGGVRLSPKSPFVGADYE